MASVPLRDITKACRLDCFKAQALQGIDVQMQPERFTVIADPSGSGRTTLLTLIGRLIA
jgi:putative ABC transport system ATP-binding protein